MLDAIALESFRAAVIHVHRQRHSDRPLRNQQTLAIVLADAQVISDDLELITGHFKHVVVVDVHESERECYTIREKEFYLVANAIGVKLKRGIGILSANRTDSSRLRRANQSVHLIELAADWPTGGSKPTGRFLKLWSAATRCRFCPETTRRLA